MPNLLKQDFKKLIFNKLIIYFLIINLNGDVLELNTEAKQLLKNNESIQIKQRRFAFNKSRQQQFELNLIELERNYQNNHDLAYNERSKTMMIDHHLFLTLDLLSPEKTNKIFGSTY